MPNAGAAGDDRTRGWRPKGRCLTGRRRRGGTAAALLGTAALTVLLVAAERAAGARRWRQQLPAATLLYQNFPNPFPGAGVAAANAARAAGGAAATCVWFDLAHDSRVRLEIYTLRGDRVRSLLPTTGLAGIVPAGRYGRADPAINAGCDPRLTWDGTAEDGRVVPAGVYLLRLAADRSSQVRKVAFKGR